MFVYILLLLVAAGLAVFVIVRNKRTHSIDESVETDNI